jgi:hypothetical protein
MMRWTISPSGSFSACLRPQPVSLAPAPPDARASRMQLHTSWRLGYAKTKMGMLRAIEIRLQDLEEQVGAVDSRSRDVCVLSLLQLVSLESCVKKRKMLRARAIQQALQKLLGGVESLDIAGVPCDF